MDEYFRSLIFPPRKRGEIEPMLSLKVDQLQDNRIISFLFYFEPEKYSLFVVADHSLSILHNVLIRVILLILHLHFDLELAPQVILL